MVASSLPTSAKREREERQRIRDERKKGRKGEGESATGEVERSRAGHRWKGAEGARKGGAVGEGRERESEGKQ